MKRINMTSVSTGIAVTSLFVALGGPAQAQSLITGSGIRNSSVTGADIKNSSLTGADVKSSSLTSSDIQNGSLTASDLKAGTLTSGSAGPAGPAGPAGAQGAAGPAGPAGPEGPSRWVLVNAAGTIEAQSGGFRIANSYPAAPAAANGNVYIESGDRDLTNNGIVASIALQNQTNQDDIAGNAGANDTAGQTNPEFSGEITATKCNIPTVVVCAPTDLFAGATPAPTTNANNYFVVSPRLSDGRRTSDANSPVANATPNRKRFYVVLSGPRD